LVLAHGFKKCAGGTDTDFDTDNKNGGFQMKTAIIAAVALLAAAGTAFAADIRMRMPMKAPAAGPPAVASWTGCYIAAGAGYGMYNVEHDVTGEPPAVPGALFGSQITTGGRGYLATAGIGCDYQFAPRWVFGVLADIDYSWLKGNHGLPCPAGCAPAMPGFSSGEMRMRWSWAVGARLGYVVTPTLLSYFSAGFTSARFNEVEFFDNATAAATGAILPSQTLDGWFIGSGIEYSLVEWIPGLYWKNEYRFADYGTTNVSLQCTTAACAGGGVVAGGPLGAVDRLSPYVHTVRTEVVYRFSTR
jgi:outer membrane immunogenic protein